MKIPFLAFLAWLASLAIVAPVTLVLMVLLGGPHGILPTWASVPVLGLGWLVILLLPLVVALVARRRLERRAMPASDGSAGGTPR